MAPRRRRLAPKPFLVTKEVKRRARIQHGTPPPAQRHESRKRKPPKHKKQVWEQEVRW